MQITKNDENSKEFTSFNQCENCERRLFMTPPNREVGDLSDTLSAEVKLVDMVIRNIKNEFCFTREHLCYGSIEELKKAIRSYIDALEEMCKVFENQ